jgi:ribosomal protein L37AE/L43A
MSDELKPCPLCQSRNVVEVRNGTSILPNHAQCEDCGCTARMPAWNTRHDTAAQVREECARVADDERQAAIRAAELGGGASSHTYGHLVYAEAVAERIAAAIRSLNEKS